MVIFYLKKGEGQRMKKKKMYVNYMKINKMKECKKEGGRERSILV